MKHLSIIRTAACAALIAAALVPRTVKADEWDKKTYLTFSGAVRVPGATLPAGRYVFRLLESPSNRYVVQVFNERENHIFATVQAIPNYRMEPPDKTVISFYETPAGQPEPIRAWFYPGDNYGREFIYSKHEMAMIAQNKTQTTDTTTQVAVNNTPVAEPTTTEVQAEQSAGVATETAQVETPAVTEPPQQTAESPMVRTEEATSEEQQPADTTPASEPTSLPSTGSTMPIFAVVGLVSVAGAMTIRAARRVH